LQTLLSKIGFYLPPPRGPSQLSRTAYLRDAKQGSLNEEKKGFKNGELPILVSLAWQFTAVVGVQSISEGTPWDSLKSGSW